MSIIGELRYIGPFVKARSRSSVARSAGASTSGYRRSSSTALSHGVEGEGGITRHLIFSGLSFTTVTGIHGGRDRTQPNAARLKAAPMASRHTHLARVLKRRHRIRTVYPPPHRTEDTRGS